MPDYIARLAAADAGMTETGPFGTPTIEGVDAVCAARARTPDGAAMLAYVGADGVPEVLFTTDRNRFAPTFYSCSFSFVKFLADRVGLNTLVGVFGYGPTEMRVSPGHRTTPAGSSGGKTGRDDVSRLLRRT